MLRVRHAKPFAAGLTSTGFWLGITVGRMVLGFVTARVFPSEKLAVVVYLIISVGLELLFWLVRDFVSSAVMVAFLGFFLAPMFPAAVVAETKLLPKRLHGCGGGVCGGVWREWSVCLSVCGGRDRTGEGSWCVAAGCARVAGGLFGGLVADSEIA